MPKVTVIPSTINIITKAPINEKLKRKVCAYARVSTDSDEQLTSYEAQKDYYTKLIQSHEDWEFAGIYADEGISGTNTKKRDAFNKMIKDALAGKIDLIITKSVSRFARNTVDSLTNIRKLKAHGVECFFEKENIYTFDAKGELLITLMSSLAQEESRSISENVKWGKRKAMSDGKVIIPYNNFLGYKKGKDGKPEIVEEEAEIVRSIYKMYLEGMSPESICVELEKDGILSPRGNNKWHVSTIQSILSNEKYKGDALLQKSYISDFLTKKVKKNNGEIPQYYVEKSHPAIIDPNEWECVQIEIAKRSDLGSSYSGVDMFASRLKCGVCGGVYGRKVWHSTSKYRTVKYQCNNKFKKNHVCENLTLTIETIQNAFIKAYNIMVKNKDAVYETCDLVIQDLLNLDELQIEIDDAQLELEKVCAAVEKLVEQNASTAQSQETYNKDYAKLQNQYLEINKKYEDLVAEKTKREYKAKGVEAFKNQFELNSTLIETWNRRLWLSSIDEALVQKNATIDFKFYNGTTITIELE